MDETAKELKKRIRDSMIAQRKTYGAGWIMSASEAIVRRVARLEIYQASQTVCIFAGLADEVQLAGLRTDSIAAGRRVFLPAWRKDIRAYGFKEWAADTVLCPGHWGVQEPDIETFAELSGSVCVVTPGLAFDANGHRVGYGAGYYDRLLKMPVRSGGMVAVGVCFDFQIQEALPLEAWDRVVDGVVTERRTLVCRQSTI